MGTRDQLRSRTNFSIDEGVECESLITCSPTSIMQEEEGVQRRAASIISKKREKKWDENYWFKGQNVSWYQRQPCVLLTKFYNELIGHTGKRSTVRILLPLIGKSVDLIWLWQQGHEVIAIENMGQSIEDFAKESGFQLTSDINNNTELIKNSMTADSLLQTLQVNMVTRGNPFTENSFDAVWDRATFAAIPPDYRGFYAEAIKKLLIWHEFRYLLLVYEFDDHSIQGPPYSVTEDQIRDLFFDFAYITRMHEEPVKHDPGSRVNKFAMNNTDVRRVLYLLQNK